MTIRILLADDHAMVRKGLMVFLSTRKELEIVGEASTGAEAVAMTGAVKPDVVLMDLSMPQMNGIEATQKLKERYPDVKVIVLTSFIDEDHAIPAIRAGAKGYLLKDIEPEDLVKAIKRVYEGKVELHPEIAGQLMKMLADGDGSHLNTDQKQMIEKDRLQELTNREQEVLRLIARGMSNRDIAEALIITEKTVKTHVSHILDKLELEDRTQAAIFAVKQGWGD